MSRNPPKSSTTPEGLAHAEEAKALGLLLSQELGLPFDKVYPTSDNMGRVTLNFKQMWNVLGYEHGYGQYLEEEAGK